MRWPYPDINLTFAGRMDSTRQQKVARLVQKEVSALFQSGAAGFGGRVLVTVTVVRVTADLGIARVYLSVFNAPDKQALVDSVNGRAREYRKMLAARVRHQLRKIPELAFYLDDSLDYAENIERLLSGAGGK